MKSRRVSPYVVALDVALVWRTFGLTYVVQAVKQISASFKPYTSVPRIAQLWKRIQEVQGAIRTLLEADFDT